MFSWIVSTKSVSSEQVSVIRDYIQALFWDILPTRRCHIMHHNKSAPVCSTVTLSERQNNILNSPNGYHGSSNHSAELCNLINYHWNTRTENINDSVLSILTAMHGFKGMRKTSIRFSLAAHDGMRPCHFYSLCIIVPLCKALTTKFIQNHLTQFSSTVEQKRLTCRKRFEQRS